VSRPPVVLLHEERRFAGNAMTLLGTFAARLSVNAFDAQDEVAGLTIDDAIAWGQDRAGLVLVQFGLRSGYWSAGATPHWSYAPWPPPDLPPLVPRHAPEEDWTKRELTRAPLPWSVTQRLVPEADVLGGPDPELALHDLDVAVAEAAAVLHAGWDRDEIDLALRDRALSLLRDGDAAPASGRPSAPAYRIHVLELAVTQESAVEFARGRVRPVPGLRGTLVARPADLD
jgi:hypothetical protein